jgi:hypothetical protein
VAAAAARARKRWWTATCPRRWRWLGSSERREVADAANKATDAEDRRYNGACLPNTCGSPYSDACGSGTARGTSLPLALREPPLRRPPVRSYAAMPLLAPKPPPQEVGEAGGVRLLLRAPPPVCIRRNTAHAARSAPQQTWMARVWETPTARGIPSRGRDGGRPPTPTSISLSSASWPCCLCRSPLSPADAFASLAAADAESLD